MAEEGVRGRSMSLTTQWSEIQQLQGRDATAAWQWFIDRYRGFVTAALRRLIWSPALAAAASEEFWGYLFQCGAVDRLERSMRFRAFLVGTLRNYAHDWLRRNPPVQHEVANDDRPDEGLPLLEDEEVALWVRQLLHLALQRLGREQPRWAKALCLFYGLPVAADGPPAFPHSATALATELGCTANALHQLLFRARQGLRNCLIEEVRQTVSSRRDLESELDVLLAALGRATPGLIAPEQP